ncbi:MAG: hypothetical protein JJE39_07400 [Vicinamibacteria bacterium]|nr:hypothetical protein [Vicinamibacteria bacterium]
MSSARHHPTAVVVLWTLMIGGLILVPQASFTQATPAKEAPPIASMSALTL